MSIVSIGDFTVDLKERRVFAADTELTVEPKVVEVLCYLIEHNSRYVSLAELHDNVWAGRVVTDTAVRRTISKLRVLLDDTDAENPQYIKSQMKRGYQLICSVSTEPDAGALLQEGPPVGTDNDVSQKLAVSKPVVMWLAIAAVIIAVIYYVYAKPDPQPLNQLVEIETLLSIPGQKTSLTVSKDGRLSAFVAKVDDNSNWELYLYDAVTGQLRKIDTPSEHCRFVNFIDNDTRLAYVGYDSSEATFYTQSVLNLSEAPIIHPTAPYPLLGNVIELENNKLLVAAKSVTDNFHYYQYDLTTNTFEQFTYSGEDGIHDAFAVMSPNKQLLALGRGNIKKKNVMLQLYRIADKQLIAEYKLQDNLQDFRLSWMDNATLLFRTGNIHYLINIENGERQLIPAKPAPLHEFTFTENGELIGLNYHVVTANIYQASWPLTENFNKSYQLGANVRQLSFSHNYDYLWLVEHEPNAFRLSRYFEDKNSRELVMQSAEPFIIRDQSADGSLLLLDRRNRLEIYNTITAEITAVSVATQDVRSGNFSRSAEHVYFAEQVKGQWLIKRFTLANKTQSILLHDYVKLFEIPDGFVAADIEGKFWRLDDSFNKTSLLYEGALVNHDEDVVVRGNQLILAYRTLMGDWVLANINLSTQQVWQRSIPFHDFGKPISIDRNGENLIFKPYDKEENHIVKYGYNFGYNFGAK
ncbi:winged helix-turn-helix domain-containing protein [Arsukibacterium indicum]|uniref:Winged helix-turn-helix domain-containing protein n=1 Tax=Arsukibacterium indicum TaxID=2848612 RepID=A0ABS6MN92_9GAMM|nr:winged helix-turn-helix domain-containing protein [Arsukibacterium indicum]MBV2130278.1 winged helix-turn-helix domain-containing protein [Arsukibacterium indicum]